VTSLHSSDSHSLMMTKSKKHTIKIFIKTISNIFQIKQHISYQNRFIKYIENIFLFWGGKHIFVADIHSSFLF